MIGPKVIIYINHAALRYLLFKKDAIAKLIRWILLQQEFELEIQDKKGSENVVVDHLSMLNLEFNGKEIPLNESFPDEQLLHVSQLPWFADIVNFLMIGQIPSHWTQHDKSDFLAKVKHFFRDDPYLFEYCPNQII